MVEMTETSEILSNATARSLVILDELGRGTSTVDGYDFDTSGRQALMLFPCSMAVADSVLQYLHQTVKCKTLFITHYPLVAMGLERKFPQEVENIHMGYTSESRVDGTRQITFLYRLTLGIATESFGVECARLGGIPEPLLQSATERSKTLQRLVEERSKRTR
jgi:DNA mismatch repair protein MSH3